MAASIIAVSQRGSYTPSKFTSFLWWLSTAEPELLADSVIDRNRYRIIGMTVLGTWAFAILAWTYFFSTVMTSTFAAIACGMFMGFIILTIDRALIKGITKFNKRNFLPLLFRGLLAMTIGTFMAQPVVLYMFDKEIKLQSSLDNEKKKALKKRELDNLYSVQKNELLNLNVDLKNELTAKYKEVEIARNNFLAETDGSGGSGKVGIKDIAIAKRNEYQKLDIEYQSMLKSVQAKLDSSAAALASVDNNIQKEQARFELLLNDGFLTRTEALSNILKNSDSLKFRYYLIVIILVLIELMPVISKTMLPSGSYDEKVMLREQMEINLARRNIEREQQLKELYNQTAFQTDSEAINNFFSFTRNDRDEKIKNLAKKWKAEDQLSFDSLWEQTKKNIITRQEN